jgi:glycosyltransferase involved in cell wall biosynthesis
MVLLEALSCGLPIAAYPVMGPLDVVGDSNAGILNSDLKSAALEALYVSRDSARNHALSFSWENSARQFMDNIAYAHGASTLKMDADPWLLKQVYLHSENMRVGKNQ